MEIHEIVLGQKYRYPEKSLVALAIHIRGEWVNCELWSEDGRYRGESVVRPEKLL